MVEVRTSELSSATVPADFPQIARSVPKWYPIQAETKLIGTEVVTDTPRLRKCLILQRQRENRVGYSIVSTALFKRNVHEVQLPLSL